MNFLDDWNKKNKQTQKKAGVQSASLPAAQKAELKAPLALTKSGVVMADGKGGGKLITPTLGPKAAQTPIVKPMAAQNAQRSGQLVNTGTMISDTGSNKRQAPLTLTKSGVVMADGKGGGKLITPTLGPKATQTPIVKPMAAQNAQRSGQLVNTGTMLSDTGSNKRQVPAVTTPKGKAQRTVDDLPDIAAFGAGAYGADKKPLQGFLARAGKTVSGGAKGSLAGNMDAMGVAYQTGQGGRTQRNTEELQDAQWAVARAKYAYDTDRSPAAKSELDNALTKMRAFATVLGDGAYEQALDAAYDAAARFGTADLNELYNSLGNVQPVQGTGVQQRAGEAARDLAADVQESANRDIEAAKTGVSKFWQNAIDAGASMTQSGIDAAASAILGLRPTRLNGGYALMGNVVEKRLPGAMIPFATRAFGGAAMEAREGGGDLAEQIAYGAGIGSVEVATELISNVALPFAKAYGGGALDDVVQRGIQKAVSKLGKTEAGKRVLNAILQMTASGAGEGFEELVAQWAEWQMPRIYGGDVESVEDNLADSLQSFIVGGMSGVAGSLVSPDTYRYKGGETSAAEEGQGTAYRGVVPQNIENPRVGRLEMSSAPYNPTGADISTIYGNRYRNQVKENAIRRLGIADGKPAYLAAPNITKDGREYYVDVTKASLNKMLYTGEHEMLPLSRILLVDNLEKAIDGSYWAESNGDRKGRDQINGFDTLRTSFYIDGVPYYADIKVKVVTQGRGNNPQNVAYFLEPEEITSIKRMDTPSPTGGRPAPNIVFRDNVSIYDPSVSQNIQGVNTQDMPSGAEYARLPRLVDANGMDAAQRAAWRQALEQMPREKQMQFEMAADIAWRFGAVVQARTMADGVQGSYQDGVISIDPTAVDPVRQVLIHELTHHMESSGLYGRFSDAALQFVAEDMGADVDTLRRAVMADYARAGVALDEDGATREIVAKFAEEKLFTDEETVRRLLARDRNLFQRVYDWIRDTVAKLQGTREQRRLIDAQNLYERALRQAADGAQSAAGTQGAAAYSFASQTVPTWEKLGQKPDIEIVDIRNNGRKLPYAAERHDILNSEEVRSLYSQPPVNRDTGELIFVTPATLSHSFSNSGEDSIYAVRHLRKILENAVLTHAEPSRKANDNSTGVYTLFGAVRTETGIQPVKLKVKEYRNVGQDIPEAVRAYFERNGTQEEYSRAYDSRVLSLESIEKEEPSSSAFTSTPNGAVEYPSSSSTIRVHDLLRLVNSRYRKYVPTFSEMEKELSTGRSIEEMTGEHLSDEDIAWQENQERVRAARKKAALDQLAARAEPPVRRGEGHSVEAELQRRREQDTPKSVEVPPVNTWGTTFDNRVSAQQRSYAEAISDLITQQVSRDAEDMRDGTGRYARAYWQPESYQASDESRLTYEQQMEEAERVAADRRYWEAQRRVTDSPWKNTDMAEQLAEASRETMRQKSVGEKLIGAVESMDGIEDSIRADGELLQMRREAREAEGMRMPETLRRLGVEPFGSEADYLGAEDLAEQVSGNERARRRIKKEVAKIPASEKEKLFARQLADGTISWEDVPQTVNRSTVDVLADYYRTMDTGTETQLLRDRRNLILEREVAKMPSLLGMDVRYDEGGLRESGKPSGRVARQVSTLRRNLQTPARVCATEWGAQHGRRVYETLFYPVTENNGRQIDWVNSMLDRVRTFRGTDGKARELNREERGLVQRLVETRTAEARVKRFEKQYAPAVENVRNGEAAEDAARTFGIDKSQQEYQDLQNYAAYLDAKKRVKNTAGVDAAIVDAAVKAYGTLYQELYEGINTFLTAHGYKPIGFIEGYAPHMQPETAKTAFSKALKMLGLDDTAMMLPTSISGMTADLKPYKQYDPFFQTRYGDKTEYDITKGFENYVYYLGNIFYHTDDIMRIRTAAKYIRKTYTSEEASEQISWAENARNFDDAAIEDFLRFNGIIKKGTQLGAEEAKIVLNDYIDGLYEQIGDVSRYSEMVKYLDNYANRLAGKQNMLDRGAEAAAGRRSLNWVNSLLGKYGGAKLAFNVSSALNQTSQLPMVMVENGELTTAKAIRDFFTKSRSDFVQHSNFLKGKKGVDWILGPETGWEKFKEAGFSMTEAVDSFTSYVAVRSKYLKEIRLGASDAEAIRAADEYGRNVMGSRARGEKPMLFDTKNPFWQIATRFQLEAMNSWEHITRDLPAEIRQTASEKGKVAATGQLAGRAVRYTLAAFLINCGIGALSGGSPVPYDILGSAAEAVGAAMGMTKNQTIATMLDGVLEAVFDQRLFGTDEPEDDEEKDWWAALESLFGNAANDVPILGRAAALAGIGDQTLPTADFSKVGDLVDSARNNGILTADTLDKALTAGGEFLYGGNQLRKTVQGGMAAAQGGVYSKGKLRYQVERTPWNVGKALLFGRSALDETEEYYAEKLKTFSEKQTAAWEKMQEAGEPAKTVEEQRQRAKESYDLIRQLSGIEKENDDDNRAALQRQALRESDVSDEAKAVVWYEMMASEKDRKTMDALKDADMGEVARVLMDMKDRRKDSQKLEIIMSSSLTDAQKGTLYLETLAGDEDKEKVTALKNAGMDAYQYLTYKTAISGLSGRTEKLYAIHTLDLSDYQKDALYYLNGWSKKTHDDMPWLQGVSAEAAANRLALIVAHRESQPVEEPKWQQDLEGFLGTGTNGNPFTRARLQRETSQTNPFTRARLQANINQILYSGEQQSAAQDNPFTRARLQREAAQQVNPFLRGRG